MAKKKKNEDLEQTKRTIEKVIKTRYDSDGNEYLFPFILLLIFLGLIVGGGIGKNIYAIISGSIGLIFLYFTLK